MNALILYLVQLQCRVMLQALHSETLMETLINLITKSTLVEVTKELFFYCLQVTYMAK